MGEIVPRSAPTSPNPARALVGLGVLTTIVGGFLLRLDGISSSLWLDEFGTLWAVEGSLRVTWERALAFHGQSPFYYTIVWGFVQVFGESELALRSCSLFFGLALWVAIYVGVRDLYGRRAGIYSIVLVGFCPTLIRLSAEARPYGLALFCLTIAVIGFLRAGENGDRTGRIMWVVGGALTAWAHYVLFAAIMGMVFAYLTIPALRRSYCPRMFLKDLLAQVLLVSLTIPHLAALLLRRESLNWLAEPQRLQVFLHLLPFAVPIAFGELATKRSHRIEVSLRLALYSSVVFTVLLVESLSLLGVNLLSWRYLQGVLVPILVLASASLARCRPLRVAEALIWAFVLSGAWLLTHKVVLGSFTGLGGEDWRLAVSALDDMTRPDRSPLVLFRSGFVEDDLQLLGASIPATRAPLRSPGRGVPEWDIVPLSYRWDTHERREYFDSVISDRLEHLNDFYFLGLDGEYMSFLIRWVDGAWPGIFLHSKRQFGGVGLIHFWRNPKA